MTPLYQLGQEHVSVSHKPNVGYMEITSAKEIFSPSKGPSNHNRGLDHPIPSG